jgi:hypothetical protein
LFIDIIGYSKLWISVFSARARDQVVTRTDMACRFGSLFQEKVEAFDNIERVYTTRVHQDDRRCWRVICARVGRVASGNCDADAYGCPKTFGAPHVPPPFA